MLKNKAIYQTQLILNATCFTVTLIASAKDIPAGKQNLSDSYCIYYHSITNSSTAMVRTVWIQIYIYINILIIYLLTTYKLLHVYIKKKSQGMSDKVKDVINCSLYYTEFLLTHN